MIITLEKLNSIDNAILVDIREEYERANYSLESALHVPMELLAEEVEQFSEKNNYILFCQSGNRSTNMVKLLHAKGLRNFYSLEGGATYLLACNYK
jgi:rhodanese-related sulfurtransferase